MKTFKLFHWMIAICLLSFCAFYSCKEEQDAPGLPPETQTGANTFGCYVNGELFINDGKAPFMQKPIGGEFLTQKNLLVIHAYSKSGYIELNDSLVVLNKKQKMNIAYYALDAFPQICPCLGGRNLGEIILTRFDTINKIVSGRFQFDGPCSSFKLEPLNDSIAHVTKGRFDIKLEILDN